jgi:hypothetical protein
MTNATVPKTAPVKPKSAPVKSAPVKSAPVKSAPVKSATDKKEKSPRRKVSALIGIYMSISRIRKYIDEKNINKAVVAAADELEPLVKDEKEGKKVKAKLSSTTSALVQEAYTQMAASLPKGKTIKSLKEFNWQDKMECVNKMKYRFSSTAPIVLASIVDYVIRDMVRNAMTNAHNNKKAIIKISHIMENNLDSVGTKCLISSLPVVKEYSGDSSEGDNSSDGSDEDGKDEQSTGDFKFYIKHICNHVKNELMEKNEEYKSIRISQEIREFCSDVAIQLIARISPLVVLYIDDTKIKTVNARVISFVFKLLITDAGCDPKPLMDFVAEKMAKYNKSLE